MINNQPESLSGDTKVCALIREGKVVSYLYDRGDLRQNMKFDRIVNMSKNEADKYLNQFFFKKKILY